MSILGCCLSLAALIAQGTPPAMPNPGMPVAPAVTSPTAPLPPPMIARPPENGTQEAPPVKVHMLAVQATKEGRQDRNVPPELTKVGPILERLPFDSFSLVKEDEQSLQQGQEAKLSIDSQYCLYVLPQAPDENAQNTINLNARIAMTQNGSTVDALKTSGKAVAGQALIFRGLKHTPGELVVIMTLRQDNQGQNQDESQKQDNQDEQKKQDQENKDQESSAGEEDKKEDPQKPEDKSEDSQETQPAEQTEAQNGEPPKDMKEVDSILQSLEEMDRREQPQVRNRRDRLHVPQDWW